MNECTLIFPHQLFTEHPSLKKAKDIYLVEEWLFFRQYPFHQHKILLHRASMKYYEAFLQKKGYQVHYIESLSQQNDCRILIRELAQKGYQHIYIAEVADNWLLKRIRKACEEHAVTLVIDKSPGFLNSMEEVNPYFDKKKKYFQTDFYIWQRKEKKILLNQQSEPIGNRWTFDTDNRLRFPKNAKPPVLWKPGTNPYLEEAKNYVNRYFPDNPGDLNDVPLFAVTHSDAEKWLDDFIKNRFHDFGAYEDAIVAGEMVLHHSVLTPMLNTGLLTPEQVIEKVLPVAVQKNIPLNSTEGFIRQVIGWREFIRAVYEREGSKQRTRNYWGFARKIPRSFWNGTTGIEPVDGTIKKILQTGYCHHIERLMVLGNFMLLCEFDPDEVYRWFMELFIDAYDWVMVPNVYGMTQFADGGLMTTKPYISGSNYLMKMGDYQKGPWQEIWDGLFWRFMHVHRSFFLQNPRLGMLVGTFDKMKKEKQELHLTHANNWLQQLDNG